MASATAAIARREELRVEADAKAKADAEALEVADLEEHRKRCRVNHRVDVALASGDPDAAMLKLLSRDPGRDIPEASWLPGRDPSMYRSVPANAPAEPDDTLGQTALGNAMLAKGIRI